MNFGQMETSEPSPKVGKYWLNSSDVCWNISDRLTSLIPKAVRSTERKQLTDPSHGAGKNRPPSTIVLHLYQHLEGLPIYTSSFGIIRIITHG
jgi:hypothetical protein